MPASISNNRLSDGDDDRLVRHRDPRLKSMVLCCALAAPVFLAIWLIKWFVTDDGPNHLYNAFILSKLAEGNAFFKSFYAARGGLLPYTATYKTLSALMWIGSPRFADRIMMTATSLGFAGSVLWLRWRVCGWTAMSVVAPFVFLLSFSKLWLYGLYGFLIGASLFVVALGMWWKWRENLTLARITVLAILLVLNFFFHIISATVAVGATVILAVTTPGTRTKKCVTQSLIAVLPTVLLISGFMLLMRHSSGEGPQWTGLGDGWSPSGWIRYLQSADFISISFKNTWGGIVSLPTDLPFDRTPAYSYGVLSPFHWFLAGTFLLILSTTGGRLNRQHLLKHHYRGWIVIVSLLLAAGILGPGGFGDGGFFRERILLLGLAAMAPLLRVRAERGRAARAASVLLTFGLIVQEAFVCDYALVSNQIAGDFMQARSVVGSNRRIGLIVTDPRTHYLLNPVPEIVNQLGLETDGIVWNNYGPAYYYVPITFRDDVERDHWHTMDALNKAIISGQPDAIRNGSTEAWRDAVSRVMNDTDFLIVWGPATGLDSLISEQFDSQPCFERKSLSLFKHR